MAHCGSQELTFPVTRQAASERFRRQFETYSAAGEILASILFCFLFERRRVVPGDVRRQSTSIMQSLGSPFGEGISDSNRPGTVI
jgi:hypothetical protein